MMSGDNLSRSHEADFEYKVIFDFVSLVNWESVDWTDGRQVSSSLSTLATLESLPRLDRDS
jgi:hypothetical protein